MFGLGLGIDYGLVMVSRFREERNVGLPVAGALGRTISTAGRTVAYSDSPSSSRSAASSCSSRAACAHWRSVGSGWWWSPSWPG